MNSKHKKSDCDNIYELFSKFSIPQIVLICNNLGLTQLVYFLRRLREV